MTTRSGTLPSVPGSASRRFKPITIAAVVAVGVLLLWGRGCRSSMPDFGAYEDVQENKDAFFGYLLPHIEAVNAAILADRADLQAIRDDMAEGDSPGRLDGPGMEDLELGQHHAPKVPVGPRPVAASAKPVSDPGTADVAEVLRGR